MRYPLSWIEEDVIAGDRFRFHGGRLAVPRGPGLGVEVDRDKLAKLHENYRRCSIRERDDTGEMKRRFPDWEPVLEW